MPNGYDLKDNCKLQNIHEYIKHVKYTFFFFRCTANDELAQPNTYNASTCTTMLKKKYLKMPVQP